MIQPALPSIAAPRAARRLVLERCRELVADRVAITRRPRTLTPRSALLELIALARAWPMAEEPTTKKKAAADPRATMVSEVAAETARVLDKDPILRTVESPLTKLIEDVLRRWSELPPDREPGDIAKLESAADLLEHTYVEDADRSLERLARETPPRLFALSAVCVAAVSELRARGWSDAGLRAWFDQFSEENAIDELRRLLHKSPRTLVCFVPVSGWDDTPDFAMGGMTLTPTIEQRLVAEELPSGPYLSMTLRAHDEADAAERAFTQARRVLDAVALVRPEIAESWRAPIVGVQNGSQVEAHHVGRWRGSVEPLAAEVHQLAEHDALGEACRYRVQAMQLRDPITRLSLLWLGLERLVTPPGDHPDTLSALRYLVPRAMALHKVRAEVGALAAAFTQANLSQEAQSLIPGEGTRRDWLELLQAGSTDQIRQLAQLVGQTDLRLSQWLEHTRAHMAGPKAERLTRFFEATRQRIEWQILRLHRAHERLGIAGWPLAWVHDLSLHAHHYLTAILVAVMNDPERHRAPLDVLARRAAQYELFVGLLEREDKRAMKTVALLDPMTLVGKSDGH
ncbi:MAG: hypothetical protein KC731_23185 [Myxococcales bacterium]|nr:hypothetical protein [Myxococcales bacterium]